MVLHCNHRYDWSPDIPGDDHHIKLSVFGLTPKRESHHVGVAQHHNMKHPRTEPWIILAHKWKCNTSQRRLTCFRTELCGCFPACSWRALPQQATQHNLAQKCRIFPGTAARALPQWFTTRKRGVSVCVCWEEGVHWGIKNGKTQRWTTFISSILTYPPWW